VYVCVCVYLMLKVSIVRKNSSTQPEQDKKEKGIRTLEDRYVKIKKKGFKGSRRPLIYLPTKPL
jgi:hypothetical protein